MFYNGVMIITLSQPSSLPVSYKEDIKKIKEMHDYKFTVQVVQGGMWGRGEDRDADKENTFPTWYC